MKKFTLIFVACVCSFLLGGGLPTAQDEHDVAYIDDVVATTTENVDQTTMEAEKKITETEETSDPTEVPTESGEEEQLTKTTESPTIMDVEDPDIVEDFPTNQIEEHQDPPEETGLSEGYMEERIDENQLEMLACVIYQEAGGDAVCDECRYRVADVVLNRIEDPRFPDTMEGVLTEKGQYGRLYWTGVVWPERASLETEKSAVDRAYCIAKDVLEGNHSDLYGNGYVWQAKFIQGNDNVSCCGIYFGR